MYSKAKFKELMYHKRRLSSNPTPSESKFRRSVLGELGVEFNFQKMFIESNGGGDCKGYLVDFWLPGYKLVVELDGKGHERSRQRVYDCVRTSYLAKKGIKVVRFKNPEVWDEGCLERMRGILEDRKKELRVGKKRNLEPFVSDRKSDLEAQERFVREKGVTVLPTIGVNRSF